MKKQYKHQELQTYLRARIRSENEPGKALESENELSKKFGLSRTTVRRALSELVHQGLCYCIKAKGTFINKPAILKKVALIIYDTAYILNPVTGTIVKGIDESLSKAGFALDILTSNRDCIDENFSSFPASYSGLLIGAAKLPPGIVDTLFNLPIPCLTVKNYFPGYEKYAVCIDFEEGGRLAVRHLAQLGCTSIGTILAFEDALITQDFLLGIREECLENGIQQRKNSQLSFTGLPWDKRNELMDNFLRFPKPPRGVICFADTYADALYRACIRNKISVPDELMIVGCNHLKESDRYQPEIELTSLEIPTKDLGKYAAELLLAKINGEERPIEKKQPKLFVGASTCGKQK